jgi:release factor glutamine methyltransferase
VKPSVRDALARGAARLHGTGVESGRIEARVLLSRTLDISSDRLISVDEINERQIGIFESLLERRARREPLAYVTGLKEFWSMDFKVGPGVLVPRPETETLVEEALREFPETAAPLRALDVGTGSGCLLLAFLRERPNATGLGTDTSLEALAYAGRNAARHGLSSRCRFERQDFHGCGHNRCEFDVILANPPYLTDREFETSPPEIRNYEPRQALAAGPDGLAAIRVLASAIEASLEPRGRAFVEIGAGQAGKVMEIVMGAGLEVCRVIPDLSGVPRCLVIGRAGTGGLRAPLKNSVGKEPATR